MTSDESKEMNRLSKEVFGTASKWRKLVNGVPELMSRDREVMVPSKYGPIKKVFTEKKTVIKRYTVEEVKKHMLDVIGQRVALDRIDVSEQAPPSIPKFSNFEAEMTVSGKGIEEGTKITVDSTT